VFQRIFQRRGLRLLALSPAVLISQCAPQCAPAPAQPVTVTHVVDGDTVDISTGERVRIIGIDAPEVGQCGADVATARLTQLVLDHAVDLPAGARDDVDRYGRFLRYVDVDGLDAGRTLIGEGLAIARYDSRDGYGGHPRQADYVALDAATPNLTCTGSPAPAPSPAPTPQPGNCSPAYPGVCIPPAPPDLDCGQITYRRFTVLAPDPHHFDADGDGIGCEAG
jgi:endonuclease YncB( thermonuclease family)